ncbi:interleukin-15 receptor subunit alpha isoform X1 [Phalacrocorax carbo]|uniref:interleukin-15 receptor subunit alpha isoform X1 n=1 Tax=Phalacrocorax carbo TaxID=9209 RepID=UPI00311976F9
MFPFSIPHAQAQPSHCHLFAGRMRLSQPWGSTDTLFPPPGSILPPWVPFSTASQGQSVSHLPVVIVIFFFFTPPPVLMRCSHPKDVANAHINVGNNTLLNTRLRYTCNPGYKRKAGTSSLIQCILRDGSTEPDWTHTTLQCIRDPALPPLTPSPELPTTPCTKRMTQRAGTTDASPTSSPASAAMPGLPGAASRSPAPSAPDELSLGTSTLLEMSPPLGEGTAPGMSLGPTPLPTAFTDHTAVSIQTLASSIGVPVLVVVSVVACCYWRMQMSMRPNYRVPVMSIPMVALAAENEVLPTSVLPTG